ncbi:MAG: acetolactate synthase [Actinobacteria bacterium 13_1_40CM_2_65_8]|nr:MAG: acetolactate synthase [Chloroflexi bacterium 13_1_40CM_65_17]OLC67731.1 MAG: acetolactate synthase [Actinobacteria bacterium 13_1_40CM_4_65_12]OLD50587.1 MAG: acetolactate synthase [Actinobacteria bacterium 13_1_40CM_2_65_8]
MKVAHAIGEALGEVGVNRVFGLLGSGNLEVTNALVASGATFVAARHETGAVTMADAYARVTGGLGVCTVHQGPGLTNAMTGLAEAVKSRTPLLLLAAEVAASAVRSNFRIDQSNLVASVGAIPERLNGPATAVADAFRAVRRARIERRPVVLMMPLDIQAAESASHGDLLPAPMPSAVRPAEDAVAEIAQRIRLARRPLILAGRGAVVANSRDELERLGDLVGALFATSVVANGLFSGNPWSLGISGGFTPPAAAELIAEADLVLAFGASLNMWTTRHGRLLSPQAVVVQIDHEAQALGSHHRVDLPVVGDVKQTAGALLQLLDKKESGWRTPQLADLIRDRTWRTEHYEDASTDQCIDPRTLSIALDELLPLDRAVTVDSGHFMGYAPMYLRIQSPDAFVFAQGFQSIGLGLASAIGAAVARPDRITVAALGDGGALMALPELETAARLGLGMLIVIYNDAAYSAEVHHFGPMGEPVNLVQFPDTDFAAIGRAVGLDGLTVRRRVDLEVLREWAASASRTGLVIDAKVVPTVVAPWLEDAFRSH